MRSHEPEAVVCDGNRWRALQNLFNSVESRYSIGTIAVAMPFDGAVMGKRWIGNNEQYGLKNIVDENGYLLQLMVKHAARLLLSLNHLPTTGIHR